MSLPKNRRLEVNDIAALARHASMSTSYKPALLKSLVRIARRADTREISLLQIGAEFVDLYWVQTVVFRLRQAATITKEPRVVRLIRRASEEVGVRDLKALPAGIRKRLNREMANVLPVNVLELFHRSKPLAMPPLYTWQVGQAAITLSEDSLAFIRANAISLETIANHQWARFLERVNVLAPLIIEKVERNGAERGSLGKYLKVLAQIDEPTCFYCECPLADQGTPHIDHVIPWSFILTDTLWNLVLSCSRCNIAKSDRLPDRPFIDKLANRGITRSKFTLPTGIASPMIVRSEMDQFFDAALSVEWPSGWFPAR